MFFDTNLSFPCVSLLHSSPSLPLPPHMYPFLLPFLLPFLPHPLTRPPLLLPRELSKMRHPEKFTASLHHTPRNVVLSGSLTWSLCAGRPLGVSVGSLSGSVGCKSGLCWGFWVYCGLSRGMLGVLMYVDISLMYFGVSIGCVGVSRGISGYVGICRGRKYV